MPGLLDMSFMQGGQPPAPPPQQPGPNIPGIPPQLLATLRQRLLGGMPGFGGAPAGAAPGAGAMPPPQAPPQPQMPPPQQAAPPPAPPPGTPMGGAIPQAGSPEQMAAGAGAMPAGPVLALIDRIAAGRRQGEADPGDGLPAKPDDRGYVRKLNVALRKGIIDEDEHRRLVNDTRQFEARE